MRIAKFQKRQHRHICTYLHKISFFSTRINEPKTLLFYIYGSYPGENLPVVLELIDGLLA